jgi:hypothetical protein
MYLSKWNYTNDEWKSFLHWENSRYEIFIFLIKDLLRIRQLTIPEIKITADRVWINNVYKPFKGANKQLIEIQIREAGNINVLEISYRQESTVKKITLPIPKGKLREAIKVQERLLSC